MLRMGDRIDFGCSFEFENIKINSVLERTEIEYEFPIKNNGISKINIKIEKML